MHLETAGSRDIYDALFCTQDCFSAWNCRSISCLCHGGKYPYGTYEIVKILTGGGFLLSVGLLVVGSLTTKIGLLVVGGGLSCLVAFTVNEIVRSRMPSC